MPLSPFFSILSRAATPAFLVTDLTNIRYLSGVTVSAGSLLVTPKRMTLFVDRRYREAARLRRGISVRDAEEIEEVLRRYSRMGFEAESMTVARLGRWKQRYRSTRFVPRSGVIMHLRRSKTPEELRHFRRAQRITHSILRTVPRWLRAGITECEVAWKIRAMAHAEGAEGLAFESIVAFGAHTSRPHHHPTQRPLRKGDLVQIDCGAKAEGYCADQSKVFFTGKPTPEQEHALAVVREAKDAVEKMVRVGVSTHALDRAARRVLRSQGMEEVFVHSLGHGVGLDIHEGVTLSQKRPAEKLLRNEVITIEPGVYFPGKFGIRLEDEVVVG